MGLSVGIASRMLCIAIMKKPSNANLATLATADKSPRLISINELKGVCGGDGRNLGKSGHDAQGTVAQNLSV